MTRDSSDGCELSLRRDSPDVPLRVAGMSQEKLFEMEQPVDVDRWVDYPVELGDSSLLRQDFIADKGAAGGLIPKPEDPSDYVPVWLTTEYVMTRGWLPLQSTVSVSPQWPAPVLDSGLGLFQDKEKPPHYHCVRCWGEEYLVVDGERVCLRCRRESPGVILCYPVVCGSS